MHTSEYRRRNDSAAHYRGLVASCSALRTTLALAAESVGYPMIMLNILDEHLQHALLTVGMDDRPSLQRTEALCDSVIRTGRPVLITDLAADERGQLPSLHEGGIHAYVGIPLTGREGLPVGTLCLLDVAPHELGPDGLHTLTQFASVVEEQLDLLRRRAPSPSRTTTDELAAALATDQIIPWFQPLVDLQTDTVVAFEALARWQHPTLGLLEPAEFLPLAEDSDLIIDLDLAILERAAHQLRDWRTAHPDLRLNANLSGRHFQHPDCVDRLRETLRAAAVPPEAVILELTETTSFAVSEANVAHLTALRTHGFQIFLDDFGTGYSTLQHLLHLPFDGIKIDGATTRTLGTPTGDALIRALAGLAAELGKLVVVEGIETPAQAAKAQQLGATHGQGYLWSPPAPTDAIYTDSDLGTVASPARGCSTGKTVSEPPPRPSEAQGDRA